MDGRRHRNGRNPRRVRGATSATAAAAASRPLPWQPAIQRPPPYVSTVIKPTGGILSGGNGHYFGWMSQGGHSEPLLLLALFYQSAPSCLKVMGWWWGGGVVSHKILLSAPVPWIGDLGLGDWGLGLDNYF